MLSYRWQFIITFLIKGFILYNALGGVGHIYNNNYIVGFIGGDTPGYLNPIDNLLAHGSYEPDGRMPGYGAIYLILRILFSKIASYNLLILLQLVLTTLSVVVLVKIADRLFHNKTFNIILYVGLTLSTYNAIWDRYLITDSFCTSALVFMCYYIVVYTQNRQHKFLLYAGLLMTWIIFLRPVYTPVAFITLLYIVSLNLRTGKLVKSLIWFLIPIIVAEGLWVARNYNIYGKFIPFTVMEKVVPKRTIEMWKFVASYGGNMVHWHPGTEMTWFYPKDTDVPPPTIATSAFDLRDLQQLRAALFRYDSLLKLDKQQAALLIDSINQTVALYTQSIKDEYPYLYHIKSRLLILQKFLGHTGAYDLYYTPYNRLPVSQKITFAIYSFWYWAGLSLGLTGLAVMIRKEYKNKLLLWLSVLLIYCVFIHPFLRLAEWRYLMPCFPFLMFFATYAISQMAKSLKIFQDKSA